MRERTASPICLIFAIFLAGCVGAAGPSNRLPPPRHVADPWKSDPVPPGRVTHEEALRIAREGVANEVAACRERRVPLDVDTARHFSKYDGRTDTYFFDFPLSGQAQHMPFRWEAGFKVIVNAKDGSVRRAGAYER